MNDIERKARTREACKRWYAKNPEKKKEHSRRYRELNKEKLKITAKVYIEKNKEKRKEYDKKYQKLYHQRYREKRIISAKLRYEKKSVWWKEYKQSLKCVRCGENRSVCLDFHHIDPTQKDKSVSIFALLSSKEKFLEEISKCIVLCANCHRVEHANDK